MINQVWTDRGTRFVAVKNNVHPGALPSGTYTSGPSALDNYERAYFPVQHNSDLLIDLPGLPTKFILDQINLFWDKTEEFKRYGFLQKRGILLYGPPGCGKSSVVSLLKRQIVDRGGIVFISADGTFSNLVGAISAFRDIEPNRPIMTITEDLEAVLEGSNGSNVAANEKNALALYDGEYQFNNIIHVATTNRPDSIADRFIRRPGRFDVVVGIHAPTRETRDSYLKHICNGALTDEQKKHILDETDGLSLAYMREIASTYLVLNIPLKETVARLRQQAKQKYTSGKVGFTIGFQEERD